MSKPPRRPFNRIARLGRLTGRVTTTYVRERIASTFRDEERNRDRMSQVHIENAERIADTVGRLKGAAMKLGQAAAQAATSLDLPQEVTQALSKLHAEAEPIPFSIIQEDIEASLERSLSQAFVRVDPTPLGTASLAQAHAAQLHDGTNVVVKVLHRGIEDSVSSDLLALKTMLMGSKLLRRAKEEMDDAFDEIRDRLEEELDYLQEAANIARFRSIFADDPRVRVPKVYGDWSTDRVLTMDHLPGVSHDAFLRSASPEAKHRAGTTIAELYYEMAYKHRILHADPHPGNFLFEEDGRVGLIDFGCVKNFDEFFMADYATAALSSVRGNRAEALDACKRLGVWVGDDPKAESALWEFCEALAIPYRAESYVVGGSEDSLLERIQPIGRALLRFPEIRAPSEMLYLHRSLGGIYGLLRPMRVEGNWGELLRENGEYAIAQGKGLA